MRHAQNNYDVGFSGAQGISVPEKKCENTKPSIYCHPLC